MVNRKRLFEEKNVARLFLNLWDDFLQHNFWSRWLGSGIERWRSRASGCRRRRNGDSDGPTNRSFIFYAAWIRRKGHGPFFPWKCQSLAIWNISVKSKFSTRCVWERGGRLVWLSVWKLLELATSQILVLFAIEGGSFFLRCGEKNSEKEGNTLDNCFSMARR